MNTRALERLLNFASDLLAQIAAFALVFWYQFGSGRVDGKVDFSVDWNQLLIPFLYLLDRKSVV